mgnify:FL=1
MNPWTQKHEDGSIICRGHIINIVKREIIDGEITIRNGKIAAITPYNGIPAEAPYYLPGFIDSHVHIESSMMTPVEFARIASRHGSIGAVCDPHEIGNVLGTKGVELMLHLASLAEFRFAFGVPSCVPSCGPEIETSGFDIDSYGVAELLHRPDTYFLAEMMNFPGVLNGDAEVLAKIKASHDEGKPVDGHAPGLMGDARQRYADAGISTDHECTSLAEGREAVRCGMIVQIREGSAAKDYAALAPLIAEAPGQVMFCTDDSHPTDLVRGHIDRIVRRAISEGYDIMDILTAACLTPVQHYHIPSGLLQEGDPADFIAISDLTPHFRVIKTYCGGEKIYSSNGLFTANRLLEHSVSVQKELIGKTYNKFNAKPISVADIASKPSSEEHIIVASDGSLLTGHDIGPVTSDVQKIVVYDRYSGTAKPQVGYIRGFNLRQGAFAQSIAHDCHNIVAVGTSDEYLVEVINRVIEMRGGIAATDGIVLEDLPLPIAGLMSPLCGHELAYRNRLLEEVVQSAGCPLRAPFITLAFMALPVIPQLKLTDKGLIDLSL